MNKNLKISRWKSVICWKDPEGLGVGGVGKILFLGESDCFIAVCKIRRYPNKVMKRKRRQICIPTCKLFRSAHKLHKRLLCISADDFLILTNIKNYLKDHSDFDTISNWKKFENFREKIYKVQERQESKTGGASFQHIKINELNQILEENPNLILYICYPKNFNCIKYCKSLNNFEIADEWKIVVINLSKERNIKQIKKELKFRDGVWAPSAILYKNGKPIERAREEYFKPLEK